MMTAVFPDHHWQYAFVRSLDLERYLASNQDERPSAHDAFGGAILYRD